MTSAFQFSLLDSLEVPDSATYAASNPLNHFLLPSFQTSPSVLHTDPSLGRPPAVPGPHFAPLRRWSFGAGMAPRDTHTAQHGHRPTPAPPPRHAHKPDPFLRVWVKVVCPPARYRLLFKDSRPPSDRTARLGLQSEDLHATTDSLNCEGQSGKMSSLGLPPGASAAAVLGKSVDLVTL